MLLGLLAGNGDMKIDNLLVRFGDDFRAIAELRLIDSENTLLSKSALIEDYDEQMVLARSGLWRQKFCRKVCG